MIRRRSAAALIAFVVSAAAVAAGGVGPAEARSADHLGNSAARVQSASHSHPSYRWQITPSGSTDEFRGLAAVSRRVAWVSGEAGTVLRTQNAGRTWKDVSPPAATGLALRDIEAWSRKRAAVLSIGPGEDSRIYTTSNGGKTWSERFRSDDPNAFFDCMAFADNGNGLAMSDPVDGYFRLAMTKNFGRTWRVQSTSGMPAAEDGEFAFAASGTCIVSIQRQQFAFVTGGVDVPRVFTSRSSGRHWSVSPAPLRGGPAAGIYSAAFRSIHRGVLVGGDYTDETNGDMASAYRTPSSHGWKPSTTFVSGYRSGVAFVPHTRRSVVAVGPTGSDLSRNGGRSWSTFDDDRYDGVECADSGACWASGTDGRIALLRH